MAEDPTKSSSEGTPGPQQTSRHFLDLPTELLDVIYELAYPAVEGLNIVSSSDYRKRQLQNSIRGVTVQPWSGPLVDSFMVCKAFFYPAIKAYIQNQRFDYFKIAMCVVDQPGSLLEKYVRHVFKDSAGAWSQLSRVNYQSLKRLEIELEPRDLSDTEPKHAWEEILEEPDFEKVGWYTDLRNMRGLKELTCTAAGLNRHMPDAAKQAVFRKNVANLQALLLPHVTKPKVAQRESTVYGGPTVRRPPTISWSSKHGGIQEADHSQNSEEDCDEHSAADSLIEDIEWHAEVPDTPDKPFDPASLAGSYQDSMRALVNDPMGFMAYVKQLQQRVEEFEKGGDTQDSK